MSSPALSLYRELWRKIRLLPRDTQQYYQRFVKESFINHEDEGPERLDQIVSRAKEDAQWVLKKYGKTKEGNAIIVVNKRLLVDEGFAYPLTLTGLSQFVSALGGWLVAQLGWMKLGPRPSWHVFATRLLPVVAFTAGSLYFGNVAYLSLSVAFIQILKVLTPAITLTVCWAAGLERLTQPLVLSVALISAGTGAATLYETGGGTGFAWAGFACFTFSALLEALRVVYIQLLLGRFKFNTLEVLVYMSPACGALLLACAAVWERDALLPSRGLAVAARNPLGFTAALCMGFFVNLTTAYAIQMTSSLTFKVFGCIKNTLVVGLGVAMGDRVAPAQLAGYAISVSGFALYTRAKMLQARGAALKPPRRLHKKAL
ncbi:hypothetical protein WJX81_008360 [Elliptochloris bilobata]|uniref:Sugar phosphate transporter domain-containing protein n=1 Tax=Elliptochloris bilobata TaxID=381761 RepID=A0AAW1SJZ1_9CHLO